MSGHIRLLVSVVLTIAATVAGSSYGQTLSGRVYEGATGTEPPTAQFLSGVTVGLYGSDNTGDDGTGNLPIQTTTTNSEGWYSLTPRGAYDFYNIVQTNLATHVDSTPSPAATSVGGTVKSSNWIQYRYEDIFITPVTTTGNKFWDTPIATGNHPPVAVDDLVSTTQGLCVIIDALANDSDPDGDFLIRQGYTQPSHGVVGIDPFGYVYCPDAGYTGTDTFEYTISDGKGGTDTATVTITVQAPSQDTGTLNGYKRDADTGTGLAGWKIYVDQNLNGQWDSGEPYDVTDGTGYYEIPNLEEGSCRVCEVMQADWEPAGGTGCVEGITVVAGTITTQDFHNRNTSGLGYQYDFGDAPDVYGTLESSNGPKHIARKDYCLGAQVDAESDGQPSGDATGDDVAGVNDDDGVTWLTPLARGGTAQVRITATVTDQYLRVLGWIDFNKNDSWLDPGEKVVDYTTPGSAYSFDKTFTFNVPAGAATGQTFARFRVNFMDTTLDSPTGIGSVGEVEDYEVEIKPEGTVLPPGEIVGGVKFHDLDGNGQFDPGEPGLGGWTIWIDLDGNGVKSAGEETLSNPDGTFYFMALSPGTYTVHEEMQTGWVQTHPGGAEIQTITIQAGQPAPSVLFGNRRSGQPAGGLDFGDAPMSAQSGFPGSYPSASHQLGGPYLGLFGDTPDAEPDMQPDAQAGGDDNDTDGDDENGLLSINLVKTTGVWSSWEIKGYFNSSSDVKWGIWLDLNGDGDWDDSGELLSTFGLCGFGGGPGDWFRAMGAFQLPASAKAGMTYMRLRVYNDCGVTVSPSGTGGPGEVEDYAVEIKADGPGLPPGGIVHGYKWNDLNGNGLWDILNPVEPRLAGWTIWLDANGSGTQDAGDMVTQTDATGHFRFAGVPAGTYVIGEQLTAGWVQTTPGGAGTYTETVILGSASFPLMFGNRQSGGATSNGRICGSKWNDLDGDGMLDAGESYLANWQIYLDLNGNGRYDAGEPAQLTDAAGSFEFTGLAVGSYTVAERMQAGWKQTWPGGAGTHTIMVTSGPVQPACVMFGNRHTGFVPGPGDEPHVKWSQRLVEIGPNADPNVPPVFCAWNEPARSTESSGGMRQWRMDADDFHCLGPIPVTRVRWWGGYKGWTQPEPPVVPPVAWHIGFWANQVEGLGGVDLFPERLVWAVEIPFERVHFEPVGLAEFPQKFPEICFSYEVQLEPAEWFHQGDFVSNGGVFWLTVTAIYAPDATPVNMWGWTTRSPVWGRGGVMPAIMGDWPDYDERLFPGRIYPIENASLCGESRPCDMCFELLTEQPWVAWDRPFTGLREWPHYQDEPSGGISIRGEEAFSRVVADDWRCESNTPIVAAAWSGSYVGFGYEACACEEGTVLPPPDYFLLTIRANSEPTDEMPYCHPGEVLWEYRSYDYDEVLTGYDRNPPGEPNEPVYRYTVALPEDDWFRQIAPGSLYWFTVAAVYADPLPKIVPSWGWTNHRHAFEVGALAIDYTEPGVPQWRSLRDPEDHPVDMSFTLYTLP
jgi:hypothetical protein